MNETINPLLYDQCAAHGMSEPTEHGPLDLSAQVIALTAQLVTEQAAREQAEEDAGRLRGENATLRASLLAARTKIEIRAVTEQERAFKEWWESLGGDKLNHMTDARIAWNACWRAIQEAATLRAALRFYADPVSYMWWTSRPETKDTRPVLVDRGRKARQALAQGTPQ